MNEGTVATPEEYIETLEEPRRSEIRRLDELITTEAPGSSRTSPTACLPTAGTTTATRPAVRATGRPLAWPVARTTSRSTSTPWGWRCLPGRVVSRSTSQGGYRQVVRAHQAPFRPRRGRSDRPDSPCGCHAGDTSRPRAKPSSPRVRIAHLLYCCINSVRPLRAVAGHHPARIESFQPRQRRDCLVAISGERSDLRAALPCRYGVGRQRVADEQSALRLDEQGGTPRCVAGDVDDARRTGDIERGAVAERRDLAQVNLAQRAVARRPGQEASSGRRCVGPKPLAGLGTSPRASAASSSWTSTGRLSSRRARSAKPT